jgi:hypothetical protein
VHLSRPDDRLRRERQLDRMKQKGAGLRAADAAMEGDQLLERTALFELGLVEAVDDDVGRMFEAVGPPQVRRGVRRERRERIFPFDAALSS